MSSPLPREPAPEGGAPAVDADVVLDFERRFAGDPRAKDAAIRTQLGISATRYYQVLHRAIDDPSALSRDPLLVRRLQRIRAGRSSARAARRFRAD